MAPADLFALRQLDSAGGGPDPVSAVPVGPSSEPSPRAARAGGRQRLPEHLPRETVTSAPCTCPGCGGTKLSMLGEDVSEVLEYVPSYFKVVRHVRPRMSCRACETISQAPVPSLPIERGLPGPALLAHVLIAKYCDHTPLHRQSVIYARAGVELDRSTLAGWVGSPSSCCWRWPRRSAVTLGPVRCCMRTMRLPVLAPGEANKDRAPVGLVRRRPGDRPCRRPPSIATRPTARASMPSCCLGPVAASCMPTPTPASAGSTSPIQPPAKPPVGRGRLLEPRAAQALRRPPSDRFADRPRRARAHRRTVRDRKGDPWPTAGPAAGLRQARARPLLDELKRSWTPRWGGSAARVRWPRPFATPPADGTPSACFVTDGRLEMSNNAAERAIQPLALGGKRIFCSPAPMPAASGLLFSIPSSRRPS